MTRVENVISYELCYPKTVITKDC